MKLRYGRISSVGHSHTLHVVSRAKGKHEGVRAKEKSAKLIKISTFKRMWANEGRTDIGHISSGAGLTASGSKTGSSKISRGAALFHALEFHRPQNVELLLQ
ncbi:hypothetical protein EVAR_30519_1 [Eumeta japonica]|uniref:Uncharacterized protein n=1 Tax=Eumeta variegata TaxID=151549 RepID=A0A4C1W0V1_EUMVA|nr:hypothetical protein EVAR_30519_1 [Eumeta japonica]